MKAHLEGPNLTDARLGGADLTMSMLRKANLEGSDPSRARLENAGLTALYLAITVLFERRNRLVQSIVITNDSGDEYTSSGVEASIRSFGIDCVVDP